MLLQIQFYTIIDPRGRVIVTSHSDHYIHTGCPSVCSKIYKIMRKSLLTENFAGRMDHWWLVCLLIHETDPHVTASSDHYFTHVRTSVPTLNYTKQFPLSVVIATGGFVGLAEGITFDTYVLLGLFLEGASLDRKTGKLVESRPKVLYEQMPVIYIYAINTTAGKDSKLYECPIYRKPARTDHNYIGSIDFESDIGPRHWTMRGVALLCDIKWIIILDWIKERCTLYYNLSAQ